MYIKFWAEINSEKADNKEGGLFNNSELFGLSAGIKRIVKQK